MLVCNFRVLINLKMLIACKKPGGEGRHVREPWNVSPTYQNLSDLELETKPIHEKAGKALAALVAAGIGGAA
jgi:hypothetical protein